MSSIEEPQPLPGLERARETALVERGPRADPLLGQVLHGVQLQSLLAEGSTARVYRAKHLVLDREYAIKVLSPAATEKGLIERLRREALALSQLSHENIVAVLDFGVSPRGRPFLTMELLLGPTLAGVLRDRRPLDPDRIRRIAAQVAAGLHHAHMHGLVHRDLKPSNIMLVTNDLGDETAKVTDFGIVQSPEPRLAGLTGEGILLGTPRYMAPEQVLSPKSATVQSDLYALGVVLYEMLAGRPPFDGEMVQILEKHFTEEPEPLVTETGLEGITFQLLSKRPEDRPENAQIVEQLIRSTISQTDLEAPILPDITFSSTDETVPELEDVTMPDFDLGSLTDTTIDPRGDEIAAFVTGSETEEARIIEPETEETTPKDPSFDAPSVDVDVDLKPIEESLGPEGTVLLPQPKLEAEPAPQEEAADTGEADTDKPEPSVVVSGALDLIESIDDDLSGAETIPPSDSEDALQSRAYSVEVRGLTTPVPETQSASIHAASPMPLFLFILGIVIACGIGVALIALKA